MLFSKEAVLYGELLTRQHFIATPFNSAKRCSLKEGALYVRATCRQEYILRHIKFLFRPLFTAQDYPGYTMLTNLVNMITLNV